MNRRSLFATLLSCGVWCVFATWYFHGKLYPDVSDRKLSQVDATLDKLADAIDTLVSNHSSEGREDPRDATRKAMADHPGTPDTSGGPNAPDGATRRQQPGLPDKSNREPDRTKYSYE